MIIAVDFDGTLCENNYPGIGAPKLDVINTIKKMQAEGHEFILWTCRVDDLLNDALKFLEDHDLHFSKINQDSDFLFNKVKFLYDNYEDNLDNPYFLAIEDKFNYFEDVYNYWVKEKSKLVKSSGFKI